MPDRFPQFAVSAYDRQKPGEPIAYYHDHDQMDAEAQATRHAARLQAGYAYFYVKAHADADFEQIGRIEDRGDGYTLFPDAPKPRKRKK